MKKKDSVLRDRSYKFAIRIVKLSQYLKQEKKEFDMSKQILRSGTSIGALIREAEYAQSDADFISKFRDCLKISKYEQKKLFRISSALFSATCPFFSTQIARYYRIKKGPIDSKIAPNKLRKIFKQSLSISLKEANETAFWLSLLKDTDYMEEKLHNSLSSDCEEIISMLVSTVKTMKSKTLNS